MPDQQKIMEHVIDIVRSEGFIYRENVLELLLYLRSEGAISRRDANAQKRNPKLKNHAQLGIIWIAIEAGVESGELTWSAWSESDSREVFLFARVLDDKKIGIEDFDESIFRHTSLRDIRTAQEGTI